jgi:hypothetical protein
VAGANDPYVKFDGENRLVYRRGTSKKKISGDCSSCGNVVVVDRRVAWFAHDPTTRAGYTDLHVVNVKTGRRADVKLRRFPGATATTLAIEKNGPPQLAATKQRLVVSVTADDGKSWTLGAIDWPV